MDALCIKNITKKYEKFTLNDVSFSIPQGCIMGLIGENGAGKSTVIKAILDLIRTETGEVKFYGETLTGDSVNLKEDIGIVFDTLHFHDGLTPEKIDKISKYTYKNHDSKTFRNYLEQFKLSGKMKISEMSKGMKMKLNIAIALSHNAKLLILDEPTGGLDPIARDELLDIFLDFMQDETHSILISSHITSDLEKIADYITFIHEGNVIFTKSKDELIYEYRIVRCGEKQFEKLRTEKGAIFRKMDYQYEILLPNGRNLEGVFDECTFERPTIDEIMLLHVKGEQA